MIFSENRCPLRDHAQSRRRRAGPARSAARAAQSPAPAARNWRRSHRGSGSPFPSDASRGSLPRSARKTGGLAQDQHRVGPLTADQALDHLGRTLHSPASAAMVSPRWPALASSRDLGFAERRRPRSGHDRRAFARTNRPAGRSGRWLMVRASVPCGSHGRRAWRSRGPTNGRHGCRRGARPPRRRRVPREYR